MAYKSITPTTAEALYLMLYTLNDKLPGIDPIFGVTADDLLAVMNGMKNVRYIIDTTDLLTKEKEQGSALKELICFGELNALVTPLTVTVPAAAPAPLVSGVWTIVSAIIAKIKKNTSFNTDLGKTLGIIGPEIIKDFSNVKSEIKLKSSLPEGNEFKLLKHGAEAVRVFGFTCDPDKPVPKDFDGLPFEVLGTFTHSPYVDKRVNKVHKPETRCYYTRLVVGDKMVGLPSDISTVPTAIYTDEDGNELSGQVK